METDTEESSTDEEENRTATVRRWNSGVPIGGIRVLNRLNTDTPPGPPSVEDIQIHEPTAGRTGGQLANLLSTKPPTAPAAPLAMKAPAIRPAASATQVVPAVAQVIAATAAATTEREQRERRETRKHQKNMLKFIDAEPVTEESDSEPDERNMAKEDIEQAMVDAFAIIVNTHPGRLAAAARVENASKTKSGRQGR